MSRCFFYDWEMQFSSGFSDLLNYHMEGEQHYRSTWTEWKKKTAAIRFWNTFSCSCKKVEFSRHSRLIYGHKEWQRKIKLYAFRLAVFAFFVFQWPLLISFLLQLSFLFVFSFPLSCEKTNLYHDSSFLRWSSIPLRLSPWSNKIFPNEVLMVFIPK